MQECTFQPKIISSVPSDVNTSTRDTSIIVMEETNETEISDYDEATRNDNETK